MKTWKFDDGDLVIDRNVGRPVEIQGTQKAAQDVAYMIMTNDDKLRQQGCGLFDFDKNVQAVSMHASLANISIMHEVYVAIERLMTWQKFYGYNIPDAERVLGIGKLNLIQSTNTSVIFDLQVNTADEDVLQETYQIRLTQQFPLKSNPGIPGYVTDDNRNLI